MLLVCVWFLLSLVLCARPGPEDKGNNGNTIPGLTIPGLVLLDACQEGWSERSKTGSPTWTYDDTECAVGSASIRMTLKQGEMLHLVKALSSTLDATGKVFVVRVRVSDVSKLYVAEALRLTLLDGLTNRYMLCSKGSSARVSAMWRNLFFVFDSRVGEPGRYFYVTGSPDPGHISHLDIGVRAAPAFEVRSRYGLMRLPIMSRC